MSSPRTQRPRGSRGICVIGMGRSGTSLLANLMGDLGVALGPAQEMLGPAARGENPRGYWEQRKIMNLNDALLAQLGGGWFDVVDLPAGWELAGDLDDLYSEARNLVDELFGDEPLWAFKDPRASLTFPFWERVAGPLASVICVRDPAEVASSLESRDALAHPRWRSSAVWLAYTSYALEHTRGRARQIFHYEEVMRSPKAQLDRLARFLEVDAEAGAVDAAVQSTVDATLWHHQADGPRTSDPFLLPEAVELYGILKSDPGDPDLEARAVELRRAGLARVGPVAEGRLPPLRGARGERAPDGERFDPESMSGAIEAEHVLRYLVAARLAPGREVLDAGCGLGYGTAILAAAGAKRAVGVDLSEATIQAARAQESAEFEVADVASLPFGDRSFDLVTCFEAIEHLVRREEALDELARVLRPAGMLLISTPNRLRYPEGNPYHVYEYEPEEFRLALKARFSEVRLLRQYTLTATLVRPDGRDDETLTVPGGTSAKAEPGREIYTLAVASDSALLDLPAFGAFVSPDDPASLESLVAEAQRRNASMQRRNDELQQRNNELREKNLALREQNNELREQLSGRRK